MTRNVLAMTLLCIASLGSPASAGLLVEVTSSVISSPVAGGFTYNYHVSNPLANANDSDPDLFFEFGVVIAGDAALSGIVSPDGWVPTYGMGDLAITWIASDLPFATAPGVSQIFSFTSMRGPGETGFNVLALNQLDIGGNVELATGATLGPVGDQVVPQAVPEPGSFVLLGSGALVLVGYAYRRGKKTQNMRILTLVHGITA